MDTESFSYSLWFAVRYVHVASIALLSGGAFIVAALQASPRAPGQSSVALAAATIYEWAFWAIAGVTVATGVSNLGLKGEGLLGPSTQWGIALTTKLEAVLAVLALSVVRSDFLLRVKAAPAADAPRRGRAVLGVLYGLTCALFLAAMWLGLGLAHGRY